MESSIEEIGEIIEDGSVPSDIGVRYIAVAFNKVYGLVVAYGLLDQDLANTLRRLARERKLEILYDGPFLSAAEMLIASLRQHSDFVADFVSGRMQKAPEKHIEDQL